MKPGTEGTLLRIFLDGSDHLGDRPMYEAIVLSARKNGLAGATVLRGGLGFGRSNRLHSERLLRVSQDLPLIVEIVDSDQRIQSFLPVLEDLMHDSGMVTMEKVQVFEYRQTTNKSNQEI
jgi:hypothetical protein